MPGQTALARDIIAENAAALDAWADGLVSA